MHKIILTFLILFFLTGCGSTLYKFRQQAKLTNADNLLIKGDIEPAINLLKEISNEKGVTGVTDEAMFMLALAYLSDLSGKNPIPRLLLRGQAPVIPLKGREVSSVELFIKSEEILFKLQKEYPQSLWAIQSIPIIDMIKNVRKGKISQNEMDQEINSLKQENKKLKLNIEKLKTLDIEMEKRHRN